MAVGLIRLGSIQPPQGEGNCWILVNSLNKLGGQSPGPKPPPEPSKSISKVLDEAYAADRSSKADVLSEAAGKTWNSDQAKLNWINEQAEKKRVLDFRQFYERVAQALVDGTDAQIAEQIRSKK